MNPYVDSAAGSLSGDGGGSEGESCSGVSYAAVAARLLQDNFLLTALELHTELVESGRELPQLREFFSNPGNFEQHVSRSDPTMQRTASQATLDSLDMARYSEEGGGGSAAGGGGGSDVAVLEFELRKAKETINSLRANLTQFADCESSDNSRERHDGRSLKPHEKRALNFLVNEYLLLQHYRLTSITFSDENPDQDFEDWDDVGLNVPRPCGLISLYRGEPTAALAIAHDAATHTEVLTIDTGCQTDCFDDESICVSCQTSFDEDTDWNHEILIQAEEIVLLKQQVLALETDKLNFHKLYDAALASLNSLSTPVSEAPRLELATPPERPERASERPLTHAAAEDHYGSGPSTSSVTPDQFEMIECERSDGSSRQEGACERTRPRACGDPGATLPDDGLSLQDAGDWTRVQHPDAAAAGLTWMDSSLPSELKARLLSWCGDGADSSSALGHDLVSQLLHMERPITSRGLVTLAAETLLRIVPNTLVSRRCETAALIAATVHLLAAAPAAPAADALRAQLLQLLLTLLKKPDPAETRLISDAVCVVVRWGGGGGGEALACAAEQLASRSAERRALAGRVCVAAAPHAPLALCPSLLLSAALALCAAGEADARRLGVRTLALVAPVAPDKYAQLEDATFALLKDPADDIRADCVRVLAPVLSRTALEAGKFSSVLCQRVMSQLVRFSNEGDRKNVIVYLDIVRVLVPPTLAHVMNVQMVKDRVAAECDEESTSCGEIPLDNSEEFFLDLNCYIPDYRIEPKLLIAAMNNLIRETPDLRWPELNWFLDEIVKELIETSSNSKLLSHAHTYKEFMNLFSTYCESFGEQFCAILVKPIFCDIISDIEQRLEQLQEVNVDSAVLAGIYLAAVLPCSGDGDAHFTGFLKKWVVCSGVCGLPVPLLATPLEWLACRRPRLLSHALHHIREIVANCNESRSGAPVRSYIASLLCALATCTDLSEDCFDTHMLPAVVTLVRDEDSGVRERGVVCAGAVARASVARSLACAPRCRDTLAAAVRRAGAAGAAAGEAARAADALVMLLAPELQPDAVLTTQVLQLLCELCESAPLTSDVLSSLLPALQLAVHYTQPDATFVRVTLQPALRRVQQVDSPSLLQHKQAADALLASVSPAGPAAAAAPAAPAAPVTPSHRLAGPEAVGRRVTQIFNTSKTNIPNIFKKKT